MFIVQLANLVNVDILAHNKKGIGYENNKYLKIAIQEIKWAR